MRRLRLFTAGLLIAMASVFAFSGVAMAQESGKKIPKASQECIDKLQAGGTIDDCQQAPSLILPATNELVWGILSFVVLFALLSKFAYPPIKQGMEARVQRIRDNLDEAERTKADAQGILEEYQRQLADAKNESGRIIEEARQTAEQMRRDLIDRAEAEVVELRERSRSEIEAARDRAVADLRAQVAELAIGAAEVVVQRNLDRDTNRALVERYIEQVGTGV